MPGGRPKGSRDREDSLELFAKRIETRIRQGMAGSDSMERRICRMLTGKDPKVAAVMAAKWVEWRYGKATEKHEHEVKVRMTIGDADRIIAEYFSLAADRALEVGSSDQNQATQQDSSLLPA